MSGAEPELLTISDVMQRLPGASERTVRALARKFGCFRAFGRVMLFTEADFTALLENAKPKSSSVSPVAQDRLAQCAMPSAADAELNRAKRRLSQPRKRSHAQTQGHR